MEEHERTGDERNGRRAATRREWAAGLRPAVLAVVLALVGAGGCGDDGGSGKGRRTPDTPTSTPTAVRPTPTTTVPPTRTSVPTPAATASPTPSRPVEPTVTPTRTADATPSVESCDVTDHCPVGQFCELPVGVCASALDSGACVAVPFACFEEIAPVCGCEGLTYGSDCLRRGASAQKARDGVCAAEECRDDCDCYATRTFATSCPLDCANCDSYWTCEERRCIERCGPFPPDRCDRLCSDAASCGPDAFCRKPVGRCDGFGACSPRPKECPGEVAPVCGCDAQTYPNECEASRAGVALAHRGPCEAAPTPTATPDTTPTPRPCDITDPCPARQLCELPAGVCATDLDSGTCVAPPDFCLAPDDAVCGCDGLTYGSDCLRRAARVQKLADGPCAAIECDGDCDCYATRTFAASCPLACPNCGNYWTCDDGRCIEHCGMLPPDPCALLCTGNGQCAPEAFCEKPTGRCDDLGACRRRPQACPDVVDPACGCDRRTYSNACEANHLGVTIAHRGACRPTCGGIAGVPCAQDQYCEYPPASCGAANLQGECFVPPAVCPHVVDPVCGCDGVTYGNDCERRRARAQLDHPGGCAEAGASGSR